MLHMDSQISDKVPFVAFLTPMGDEPGYAAQQSAKILAITPLYYVYFHDMWWKTIITKSEKYNQNRAKTKEKQCEMITYTVHSWLQLNVRNDNNPCGKGMNSSKINDLSMQLCLNCSH